MAENKKSFVLYADIIHTVRHLSKEDAGELFMHILGYVNDENPTTDNPIVKISFEPVKQQLKRDLIKWEEIKIKRSDAGKISAEKKKQQTSTKSTSVESVEQTSTKSTVNVSVSGSVNDNVSVNVNDKEVENPQQLLSQLTSDQQIELGALACNTTFEAFKDYAVGKAGFLIATTKGKYSVQTLSRIIVQDFEKVRTQFELKNKPKTDADSW